MVQGPFPRGFWRLRGESMPVQPSLSLRDLLTVIFKHRAKMLVTFAVTVGGVVGATYLEAPVYESSSKLLVLFGRHFIYRPEAGRDVEDMQNYSRESVINADIDILNSEDLLMEVIEAVGLDRLYPGSKRTPDGKPPVAAVRRMADSYSVRGMDKSNTLRVSFEHADAQLAADVVNTAVARFTQRHLEAFSDPKLVVFYEEKANLYRQKLNEVDTRTREYQLSQSTVDLEAQRNLLLRELNQLDGDLSRTRIRIAGLTRKAAFLEQQLTTHQEHAALYEESEQRGVEEQLLQLKLREKDLRSQFKETDRQVVTVQGQIALVEGFLGDRERVRSGSRRVHIGRTEVFDSIEVSLAAARAELAELSATLAPATKRRDELAAQLEGLPARQQQLRELERERKLYESAYENYQTRLGDARTFADMDRRQMADVSVLQRAQPADAPIRPDRKTALTIGLVVGLCLAFAVAFAFEFLASTWDVPGRAAEDLGIPVLGVVRYREGLGL
jgi:uncharacterized protein involved in exopolysaccharide biosynthesis